MGGCEPTSVCLLRKVIYLAETSKYINSSCLRTFEFCFSSYFSVIGKGSDKAKLRTAWGTNSMLFMYLKSLAIALKLTFL